jgi:hypothetical protein
MAKREKRTLFAKLDRERKTGFCSAKLALFQKVIRGRHASQIKRRRKPPIPADAALFSYNILRHDNFPLKGW